MTLTWYRHFQRNGGLNHTLRCQTSRFHYSSKVLAVTITVGRWTNVERHNRLCQLCQSREIGDEFHFVLGTDHLTWTGGLWFFVSFKIFSRIQHWNIWQKLSPLFSKLKPETIGKLCKLIDIINKKISSPWKKSITPLLVFVSFVFNV